MPVLEGMFGQIHALGDDGQNGAVVTHVCVVRLVVRDECWRVGNGQVHVIKY